MSDARHYYIEDQERIDFCVNCKRLFCVGTCEAFEKAFGEKRRSGVKGRKYDGLTLTEWAERTGIDAEVLRNRVKRMAIGEAIKMGCRYTTRKYVIDGETLSLPKVAARYGIHGKALDRAVRNHPDLDIRQVVNMLLAGPGAKQSGRR